MLKNYFKIALRNLFRNKIYTAINITGLSIGITLCLAILFYDLQELSYDDFHKKGENIYRVGYKKITPEYTDININSPMPLAGVLRDDFPETRKVGRLYLTGDVLFEYDDKEYFEEKIAFADSSFFDIFTFELLTGDEDKALNRPYTMVLTESAAEKYFGDENPVGKTILYDNYKEFEVTGVMEDVPVNSHFDFDFLCSYASMDDRNIFSWGSNQWGLTTSSYTYALLNENTNTSQLAEKLNKYITEKVPGNEDINRKYFFQPLSDIYMHTEKSHGPIKTSSPLKLIILSTIALFILILASINYMNLATAMSFQRSREVGVRKVLGAEKFQLVKQFLAESVLIALTSVIVSMLLLELFIPYLSGLLETEIEYSYFSKWYIPVGIIGFTILTGIFSGAYPALYISRKKPVDTLKKTTGSEQLKGGAPVTRRVLVVFQFVICIVLVIGTITVIDQLEFMRNADLGFEKDHNVVIAVRDRSILDDYEGIKQSLKSVAGVNSVTAALRPPVSGIGFSVQIFPDGHKNGREFVTSLVFSDYDYMEHFGLELLAGRGFDKRFTSDTITAIVINETAMKKIGFTNPQDAIGKRVLTTMSDITGTIIGVVKDYNTASLHQEIPPVTHMYAPSMFWTFTVNINSKNISETINKLEKVWTGHVPDYPFEYKFLDEYIDTLYKSEEKTQAAVTTISAIGIIIGCMGLFGLSAFSAGRKKKEIGIRKVLGATSFSILLRLIKEFSILVLIANLIAWPLAYLLMRSWLQEFAYRIDIGVWIFTGAGILTLLVAVLTVSWQALKAATANPVSSIKYE